MKTDIRRRAASCVVCEHARQYHRRDAVGNRTPSTSKLASWQIDIYSPGQTVTESRTSVLTAVEESTGYLVAVIVPNLESHTTISAFFQQIICPFGAPVEVRVDNEFNTDEWRDFAASHGFTLIPNAAYDHNSTGRVERIHRSLTANLVKRKLETAPFDWKQHLQAAVADLNSTPRADGGPSSFEAMYGQPATSRLLTELGFFRLGTRISGNAARQAQETAARTERAIADLAAARGAVTTDDRPSFEVGEVVEMNYVPSAGGKLDKRPEWYGPFYVIRVDPKKHRYDLEIPGGKLYATGVSWRRLREATASTHADRGWQSAFAPGRYPPKAAKMTPAAQRRQLAQDSAAAARLELDARSVVLS